MIREFHTDGFNGAIPADRPLVDGLPVTGDLDTAVDVKIQACESPDPYDGVDFINQNDAVQSSTVRKSIHRR